MLRDLGEKDEQRKQQRRDEKYAEWRSKASIVWRAFAEEQRENLTKLFDLKNLPKRIKNSPARSNEQNALWRQFTIETFSRSLTVIYANVLLNILVQVIVCVAGRRITDLMTERAKLHAKRERM